MGLWYGGTNTTFSFATAGMFKVDGKVLFFIALASHNTLDTLSFNNFGS